MNDASPTSLNSVTLTETHYMSREPLLKSTVMDSIIVGGKNIDFVQKYSSSRPVKPSGHICYDRVYIRFKFKAS